MAPAALVPATEKALTSPTPYQIDPSQTLRATTALLRKIQSDATARSSDTTLKANLLADSDDGDNDAEGETAIWLVLTTKKHIVDKKRLKPSKILLPHPYLDKSNENLRICLITADPQRKYKDLIADPSFPLELAKRVNRVIGITKLKAKYKSFESRRQLFGEYDVFLADDRIVTYLPTVLGKTFYKSGSKRPVPVTLEGKRQSVDEQGNKRRKLAEGGTKVTKTEAKPADVAREVEKTLDSALVHLAPSTTTAVKVGKASMKPAQLQENVAAVVEGLVEKFVPQQWRNVRTVHIKGPNTAALPIWMTQELWEDEKDVLDEPLPVKEKAKKRKRGALADASEEPETIEVPGPDGQMRRLEKPSSKRKSLDGEVAEAKPAKKAKSAKSAPVVNEAATAKAAEKADKEARKAALKQQKAAAKTAVGAGEVVEKTKAVETKAAKPAKKTRAKAADLI